MMSPSDRRGKNKTETVSSVQGGRDLECLPRARSGRRDKRRPRFFFLFLFHLGEGGSGLAVVSYRSAASSPLLSSVLIRCNCEICPWCFSIWSCMELAWTGGLKSSTSCLPMHKLCYHKRLKRMSNGPFGIYLSSCRGELVAL